MNIRNTLRSRTDSRWFTAVMVCCICLSPVTAQQLEMSKGEWLGKLKPIMVEGFCANPVSPFLQVYKDGPEKCKADVSKLFDHCSTNEPHVVLPEKMTNFADGEIYGQLMGGCISAQYQGGLVLDGFNRKQDLVNKCGAGKPTDVHKQLALDVIHTLKLSDEFSDYCENTAISTQSFAMISNKHGVAKARELIKDNIALNIDTYLPLWENNLSLWYACALSQDQLQSIKENGASSPQYSLFKEGRETVNTVMRERSKSIVAFCAKNSLVSALRN